MSKFFVEDIAVGNDRILITDTDDIKHISKVLRLKPGAIIEVSDSKIFDYHAKIISISPKTIELQILDKQSFGREPTIKISLFQGIPKQGKMEQIIQKSVELGVNSIIPTFTHRSVVTDKGNFLGKIQRWQKISDEAVKQCKRGIIPKVSMPVNFKEMIALLKTFDLVLFLYENEDERTIKQTLRGFSRMPKTVAIIIGPEGGFSEEEANQLKSSGAFPSSLGKTILRTETAGAAAIAMVMYELEMA